MSLHITFHKSNSPIFIAVERKLDSGAMLFYFLRNYFKQDMFRHQTFQYPTLIGTSVVHILHFVRSPCWYYTK